MQLYFRLDKRPGESHMALDGKKSAAARKPSARLPDSKFLRTLGTEDVYTAPPQTGALSLRAAEECFFFFCRRPLPFGGSPLEAYSRTSGESNHHRQSVRVGKNDALPTEPRGHLGS